MASAFWWIGSQSTPRKNFGDLLTPLLLERFGGVTVEWQHAAAADVLCVGSILESVTPTYSGIVAGCGKLREETDAVSKLKNSKVLGLRGPLSAKGVRGNYVLGDPGLLADELVVTEKKYNLGIVPHWSDKRTWSQFSQWNPRIIRPTDDPLYVLSEIGACKKIITSSLHGLIVADAFHIPRRIEYSETMDREGGQFKFRDYLSSIGMSLQLGVTQEAPRYKIEDIQAELFDMLEEVGQLLRRS